MCCSTSLVPLAARLMRLPAHPDPNLDIIPATQLTLPSHSSDRERSPRLPTQPPRRPSRADFPSLRIHLQTLRPAQQHHAHAEILPHQGEPQLQHGEEHGAEDIQVQCARESVHGGHGGAAGVHREILLPGGAER